MSLGRDLVAQVLRDSGFQGPLPGQMPVDDHDACRAARAAATEAFARYLSIPCPHHHWWMGSVATGEYSAHYSSADLVGTYWDALVVVAGHYTQDAEVRATATLLLAQGVVELDR